MTRTREGLPSRGPSRRLALPRAFGAPSGVAGAFAAWALGVLAVALALASVVVVSAEERRLRSQAVLDARRLARAVASLAVAGRDDEASRLAAVAARDVRRIVVRDPGGRVVWWFGPDPEVALEGGSLPVSAAIETGGRRFRVSAEVATGPIRRRLLDLTGRMVGALGLALGAALAVGLLLLRGMSAPLERLAAWARGCDPAAPDAPPPVRGPREVHELGTAFAGLVARLSASRAELEASEARFRELFAVAPAPLLVVDRKLCIVRANRSAEPFIGVPAERARALPLRRFLVGGDAVVPEPGETPPGREVRWRMPDGSEAAVALRVRRLGWPSGEAYLVALTDLTDRLRRAGELWRRTFDAMADGVAVLDPGGEVRLANAAMERAPAAVIAAASSRLVAGRFGEWEAEEDGRHLVVRLEPAPDDGGILVVRDVTARVAAERRLREALKAESVAALANGVAHDFNNLLAALELHARILEADPEGAPEALAAIHELTVRGREVVEQLLAVAREGGERSELDLAELVRSSEGFVRFLLEPGTELVVEVAGPAPVVASEVELRRVLLNLVLNAREALAGIPEPRVEIRAGREGGEAWLEVADNGPGVPPELAGRVFEPYVSRSGTGLGLASVAAIVSAHGGTVALCPASRGAVFRVRLPLSGEGARARGTR